MRRLFIFLFLCSAGLSIYFHLQCKNIASKTSTFPTDFFISDVFYHHDAHGRSVLDAAKGAVFGKGQIHQASLHSYLIPAEINCRKYRNWSLLSSIYFIIIAALWSVNNKEDTFKKYYKSFKKNKTLNNKKGTADANTNFGIIKGINKGGEPTVAMYKKRLKIFRDLGSHKKMAGEYVNLGNVYLARRELDQAVEMYQKGLKMFKTLEFKEGLACIYGNLGNVHLARQELDQAAGMYHKSLEIFKTLGFKIGTAKAFVGLVNVYLTSGERDKVRTVLRESLGVFTEMGHPHAAKIRQWLARFD